MKKPAIVLLDIGLPGNGRYGMCVDGSVEAVSTFHADHRASPGYGQDRDGFRFQGKPDSTPYRMSSRWIPPRLMGLLAGC
jgi:hypothetical protein